MQAERDNHEAPIDFYPTVTPITPAGCTLLLAETDPDDPDPQLTRAG